MLNHRRLGRTGLEVPLLGFGGIPIMRITPQEATEVIGEALRQGITFIDTARGYGDSEAKIGQALKTHGADVVLASKSPRRDGKGMLEDFRKSLSDLGRDTIAIYQLHCVNTEEDYAKAMAAGGAYQTLEEQRSQGKVGFIGITSHNLSIIRKATISDRFDTIQLLYNLVEHEAGAEIIPEAVERDVGVIAMKPLAGGCIKDFRVAIRYVLCTDGVVAIPGMATVDEVRMNVKVASDPRPLSPAELQSLQSIREELGKRFCRRCDYCQPCPNDIPISLLLHIGSVRDRIGESMMQTDFYRQTLEKADKCDQCGECEERCPFDLPVRDLISEAREALREVLR